MFLQGTCTSTSSKETRATFAWWTSCLHGRLASCIGLMNWLAALAMNQGMFRYMALVLFFGPLLDDGLK